ncbi:MAG: hypothetical protein ACI8XZ_005327 [Gammaproteobacteria bacterium]|jgi:hypothetical protein
MFLKNCWYCAGWDYELTQSRRSIRARRLALDISNDFVDINSSSQLTLD